MKHLTLICILFFAVQLHGQETLIEYQKAFSLLDQNKNYESYKIFKELAIKVDTADTLYDYVLWYHTLTVTILEQESRMSENWEQALMYGEEALGLIEKGKVRFNEDFAAREYWMIKNLIVSNFGLDNLKEGKALQEKLYEAYGKKALPEGLNEYYNFEFFRWKDKNVWGYEWYEDLPEERIGRSFSKIVYYVYSTNPDGSDKDQLYRLHVLMFHKMDDSIKFDYVLTKRLEKATKEASGTLYTYTYTDPVDYEKLRQDIREVLKGNLEPKGKRKE